MKLHKLLQLIRDNARAEGVPAIRTETTDTEAHVYVYDVIDAWWGASAVALVDALKAAGDRPVHLHINSPGGDVFEARAMAAAIVAHTAKVTTHIDGLAASAATYLAMAANEVRMTDGGLFMVHNSWTLAWGDKSELRDTANLLEKVDGSIAADYARQTGKPLDQVVAWMDATTWFTAAEAKDAGFVDAIDTNTKRSTDGKDSAENAASAQASAARWNLSAYANAPKLPAPAQQHPDPELVAQLTTQVAAQLARNRNRLRLVASI